MGAARLFKVATPYNGVDLLGIDYAQTADVVYYAHLDYPPQKAVRADHTDWTWDEVDFGAWTSPPTGLAVVETIANTDDTLGNGDPNNASDYYPLSKTYVVTAVNDAGQETLPSNSDSGTNDLSLKGNFNTITWNPVTDAQYYNVYAMANGSNSYGYIGRSETTTFLDNEGGVAPDYADGVRFGENPFDAANNYPSAVTFHQQRLVWARTRARPNAMFLSQSADFENMDRTLPVAPDDAFSFALVSEKVNSIHHVVSMRDLLALTSDSVFAIRGAEGKVLTATAPETELQLGTGALRLKPIVIDGTCFFRPMQGSCVRALGYTFEIEGFKSNNVAIFSPHLFDGFGIVSWAYQREPFSVIWAVRSDGKLLAFTWEAEHQVWGWTLCETSGLVEQVACITESGMDRVYLAVRRELAGTESVFIERMAMPLLVAEDLVDSCYLDCAVTQKTEEPTDTITGLWHLEGETVTAFADGYVIEDLVVEGGQVTLQFSASTITVGLPYSGEIETLPLPLTGDRGSAHTDRQTLAEATIRVDKTRGLKAGITGGLLTEIRQRETEDVDEAIMLKTGDFAHKLSSKWSNGASLRVVQDYPLPATISALFIKPLVTG